jgi:hypothetical protein
MAIVFCILHMDKASHREDAAVEDTQREERRAWAEGG